MFLENLPFVKRGMRRRKTRPPVDWYPSNIPQRDVLWNTREIYTVELYARVRRAVNVEGTSERDAACQFGLAWETVRKMLRYSAPSGYLLGSDVMTGLRSIETAWPRTAPAS